MADTNLSGPTFDEHMGSVNVRKTYVVTLTDVAQKVCRIEATTFKPVIVEAQVYVNTLDATETVSVGTNSTSYNNLVSAAALDTADVFLPASNATGKLYLTADADIYAIGSTGTDTGVVTVILDLATVNTATY
jgi:hypothetical protein